MFRTEEQLLNDMKRSIDRLKKMDLNTLFNDFDGDIISLYDGVKNKNSNDLKSVLKKIEHKLNNIENKNIIDEKKVKEVSDELADTFGINDIKITIKTPENEKTLKFSYPEEEAIKNKISDSKEKKTESSVKNDTELDLSPELNGLFDLIFGLTGSDEPDNKCNGDCSHCDSFEETTKCEDDNTEEKYVSNEDNLYTLDFEALNGAPLTNGELKEQIFNGKKLNDIFDNVGEWHNGHARVLKNGKYNLLTTKMTLLSDIWYNYVSNFEDDYAIVEHNHVYNVINKNGELICDEWYDWIDSFHEGFSIVYSGNICNFIDKNGKLLTNEWFDKAYRFNSGLAKVFIDDNMYTINTDGVIESETSTECKEESLEEVLQEKQTSERKRYLLMDVGGDFNAQFYNAVQYICETVHFPNSDFYTYEDESDLDLYEVDAVILLPNVWEKMLDYYVNKYSKYIDEGGRLYVINPESFELTLVNHSLELEDYQMSKVQESLLVRK